MACVRARVRDAVCVQYAIITNQETDCYMVRASRVPHFVVVTSRRSASHNQVLCCGLLCSLMFCFGIVDRHTYGQSRRAAVLAQARFHTR
jgi:hypothetical protein